MIRVALPSASSRLHAPVMRELDLTNVIPTKMLYVERGSVSLFLLRGWDIPSIVSRGLVDYGICGYDCVIESKSDVVIMERLTLRRSRIVLASRQGTPLFEGKSPVVATEYPNLAVEYFAKKNMSPTILPIKGAGEAYPHLPGIDFLLDLTTSGESLIENQLVEVDEILITDACFIGAKTPRLELPELTVYQLRDMLQREFK